MQTELKIIAHGGFPAQFPENSLEGFQEAAKYHPYAIEMDVVQHPLTGELMCFHPTGISSEKGTYTAAVIEQQLTGGEKQTTLAEILAQLPSTSKILLDIKQPTPDVFQKVATLASTEHQRLIVGVRNNDDFNQLKALAPQLETLALFSDPDAFQEYAANGGTLFRLWEKDVTPQRVAALKAAGLEVWVTPGSKATPDKPRTAGDADEQKLADLLALEVNGILVNDVALASSFLASLS